MPERSGSAALPSPQHDRFAAGCKGAPPNVWRVVAPSHPPTFGAWRSACSAPGPPLHRIPRLVPHPLTWACLSSGSGYCRAGHRTKGRPCFVAPHWRSALVSALHGSAAGPLGPFVEYHDGLAPVTREVTCAATYTLHSADDPTDALSAHHLARGERIGFRSEPDGSVSAVGPGCVLAALAPGGVLVGGGAGDGPAVGAD